MAEKRRTYRDRVCPDCGRTDRVRADSSPIRCKPCSAVKSLRLARAAKPAKRMVACGYCRSMFFCSVSQNYTYCSLECRSLGKTVERTCKQCRSEFRIGRGAISGKTNASGNFCSRHCYNAFLCDGKSVQGRGPGWTSSRNEAIRLNPFCAVCGSVKRLHVHHVVAYRRTKDNSPENLVPLCSRHHKQIEHIALACEPFEPDDLLWLGRMDLLELQSITRQRLKALIRTIPNPSSAIRSFSACL
jgi:hypothetical protein